MSVNQVLNAVDEIIDGTPKYNITDNGDGTKGIELANEVAQQGTALNKACLDQIDNVLSYLTPSVEKVETPILKEVTYFLSFPSTISGNSFNTQMVNDITSNTIPITFNATGSSISNGYRYYNGATKYYIDISSDGSADVSVINQNCKTNNMLLNMQAYQNSSAYMNDFTIDMTNIINAKLEFEMSSNSSTSSVYIEYSTNGNDYTILETITQYTTYKIINIPNNSYLRVRGEGGIEIGIFKIYVNENIPTYQNQFTLDNNTSFTNNQRVLIETDINYEEITTPQSVNSNISSTFNQNSIVEKIDGNYQNLQGYDIDFSILTTNNNGIKITSDTTSNIYSNLFVTLNGGQGYTPTNFNDCLKKTNTSDYNNIMMSLFNNEELYFYFNFNTKVKTDINCNFNKATYLQVSNDNINWVDYATIPSGNQTISINEEYQYIRIKVNTIGVYSCLLYYLYLTNIKYLGIMPYQDVTSNTLNGIDIPTLLKPSTKYELIYNETNNKFDLGKLSDNTLFDITLTEAVNQVDLTGITNKLEFGKIYALIISGTTSTNTQIFLGDTYITYGTSNYIYNPFIFSKYNNDYIGGIRLDTPSNKVNAIQSKLKNYEYIKCTSNYTFNAGTRIIIKEIC